MQIEEPFRKQTLGFHWFVSVPRFDVLPVPTAVYVEPAFTAIPVLEITPQSLEFNRITRAADCVAGITEELVEVRGVFFELLEISGAGIEAEAISCNRGKGLEHQV